jgi:glycosyltransferase involved in cell wall biosynthesis
VINQSFADWELIIIDDGSTDNTFDSIKKYLSDKRISNYYQNNSGAASARNYGLEKASGKFVTILDSDDHYKEEHLQTRHEILQNNPAIDVLHGGCEIIGSELVPDINNTSKMIHLKDCYIGGTFFIKKEILKKVGGFPIVSYGEDYLLMKKLLELNLNILKVDAPTYVYNRLSEDSVCNSISEYNDTKR